jgi:hypothetical protein
VGAALAAEYSSVVLSIKRREMAARVRDVVERTECHFET